jgi:CPA2 family monovalent cation:H+ antiporter-2
MSGDELVEIAIVAAAALICGLFMQRLRQPVIVGYITAGVLLGPSVLGLIKDRATVEVLAELGLLMLLFIIGMELSLRGFRRVLKLALLCAFAQILGGLLVMWILGHLFDWPLSQRVLFGFVVALSSTAVAIKILEDIGEIRSEVGRTAISVLIAQDLAVVPMLLIVQGMAKTGEGVAFSAFLHVALAVGLLVLLIWYLTRRERVNIPFTKTANDNPELAAVTAMAYCFCAALISSLLGLSAVYGAFLAGLWIGNSTARAPILQAAIPIQGVLLMMLFLSFGLLLDLNYIWENFGLVLLLLLLVTIAKTLFNVGILKFLGEPWPRAWLAGVSIGQIGEFSFVLVAAGAAAGLMAAEEQRLAIALIALSLMISPFWLYTARQLAKIPWRNIRGFRELMNAIYGREVKAVAVASRNTYQFTIRMGEHGKDLFQYNKDADENEEQNPDAAFPDTHDKKDPPL